LRYELEYWHSAFFLEGVEGYKLRRADQVVVVSSWIKSHLVGHFGLSAENVTVAPNGADVDAFHPDLTKDRDLPPELADAVVVGFVGSFHNWHGPEILGQMALDVAAAEPRARFVFVGDGPEVSTVKRMTASLGERVLFTGRVPHARVPGLVASFDVAVLPESHPYGSPLKVIEWMGAGRAVVAPRYDPLLEVIDDGVHGVLFPPRDGEALAAAVIGLVGDAPRRLELGRAAAKRARSSLTWDDNARRVLEACAKARDLHRCG
jgi:glycosyltransferase involved in cell wall biosynthesis